MGVSLIDKDAKEIKKYKVIESLPEGMAMVVGTPSFACKKASFTVEAAVLLPVLACFFSFILFFFQIMYLQLTVQNVLEKTGRNLSILAIKENENVDYEREDETDTVGYLALAKTSIFMELQKEEIVNRYVSGGALGISLLTSKMDGDYIVLNANYKVNFPVKILGKQSFWINQKTCFRKWTGWHAIDLEKEKDILVYLTTYGEVYHMRKSCPYLILSIQKVKRLYVPILRNADGSKYKECSRCREEGEMDEFVYITNYGERYHYKMDCSSLKRTIYQKSLSEVEGMGACTKCWK